MAKLYYGNGECSIKSEGSEIGGVEIKYRGKIAIEKTAADSYVLLHSNYKILMFSFPFSSIPLTNLFNYIGKFNIISIIASGIHGTNIPCSIHRVMDYAELLNTTPESMTTISENLSSSYTSNKKISIKEEPAIIKNLKTSINGRIYYLQNGEPYKGLFHTHLKTGAMMTGGEHTEDSQDLYIKNIINGKEKVRKIGTADKGKSSLSQYTQKMSPRDRATKGLKVRQKKRKIPKGKKFRTHRSSE